MTHQICDACECVSHCRKNGCIPVTPMPEKPALPLSTSVTSLQLELSAALEMAVRDRMLAKELAAALQGLLDFHVKPAGMDAATILDKSKFADVLAGINEHAASLTEQARAALSKMKS